MLFWPRPIRIWRRSLPPGKGDGSWENSVFATALASYALLETGFEYSRAQQGLSYLRLKQNADGGWGEEGSTVPNTSVALLALVKGGFTGDSVEKAVNYLLRRRGGDGDWGNNISNAWALLALQAVGQGEIDKTVQLWESTINIDKGWGIYAKTESDPFVSALVTLALQKYDKSHPAVAKGLSYLQK
jgi:squalene cyclase